MTHFSVFSWVVLFMLPSRQIAAAFTVNQSEAVYCQFLDQITDIVLK